MTTKYLKNIKLTALILLCLMLLTENKAFSQAKESHIQPMILNQENIFYFDSINIKIINMVNSEPQICSVRYWRYPVNAKIKGQPMAYDVVDSLCIFISLYDDSSGKLYADLMRYNTNILCAPSGFDRWYLSSPINLIDKVDPFSTYFLDMDFSKDRINGPIYFDVLVDQDSLLTLIYVNDYPKLEVWKYVREKPNPDRLLTPQDSIARKKEIEADPYGWKRVSRYKTTLTGPFKSFYHKGVCHIMAHDMKVYRLGPKTLEPVDIRVKDPSKNCLLIDKHNQQVYLTRPPEAFGEGERKGAIEAMMRDRELLFDDK